MDRVLVGSKRSRVADSAELALQTGAPPARSTPYFNAEDIAAAINIPLLDDAILLRVVQPSLRGAQKALLLSLLFQNAMRAEYQGRPVRYKLQLSTVRL